MEGELVTVGGAVVLIKAVHVFGSRGGVGDVAYEVARGGGGRAAERWACCWTARALLCYPRLRVHGLTFTRSEWIRLKMVLLLLLIYIWYDWLSLSTQGLRWKAPGQSMAPIFGTRCVT